MLKKLGIITTHPIQYNAPFFKLLADRKQISIKVFYTWGEQVLKKKYDPGFGKEVEWDIPLLDGYEYIFVNNIAKSPGSGHFMGIDNPDLIREIVIYDPSALLVFGWNFKSHLQCLRYFRGKIPILFRGDSTLLNEKKYGLKKIARTLFLKWVYRHIDFALYTGTNNKHYFERNGLKENQLFFAPHAVDNDRFSDTNLEYSANAGLWKEKLGIAHDELTILFAGKLENIKNPFFLLKVAERLQRKKVKFIIAGNGPMETELKAKANTNEQIAFIDFQNQSVMPVVYRLGDIFMLCSHSETWGLGINEAMASGCAIAVSNTVGGAVDLVTENYNGFTFDLNEVEKCSLIIDEMINNKNKLAQMKIASLNVIQKFSFQHIAEPIESIVLSVAV